MRPAVRVFTLSIVLLLAMSASAAAATPYADISSAGPLTHVYLGNELSCQADRSGAKQLYPTANTPGDCGTFASYGGTLYKPDFAGHGGSTATGMGATGTVFTPVSQSAVTGAGTIASPYTVVTVVTAGPKLRMTQTETYVTGDEHWSTRLDVANLDSAALTTSIYRAMDCFLGGADNGYGYKDAGSGGVGCSAAPDNSPAGVVEALIPAAGQGAVSYEATYSNVWLKVRTQATLDGTCICSTLDDNGVALQWQLSLAVGETKNLTFATLFSPTGVIPPPPAAPANVTAPDAGSGAVTQGTAVTATAGTWTDASSQSQRWQRCTTTSAVSCADISGATGLTYTPVADDVGSYLRIVETATNTTGTTEQASAIGSQVLAAPPVVVTPPASTPPAVVTPPAAPGGDGELVEGGVLRADDGAFADAVGARQYQFQRCASSDPASCADIPGATGSSYRSTEADVGYRLRLLVTASNAGGSTTAASSMTSVVRGSSAGDASPAQPCVSDRVMRLHWSVPQGAHMRGFTIRINGRLVATLSGRARTVRISLRGRSPQTVRVAIRGRRRSGGALGSTRTYRTCTKVRSGTLKSLRLTRLRS